MASDDVDATADRSTLRVRAVCMDYYMSDPSSATGMRISSREREVGSKPRLRVKECPRPVIRIFGPTGDGQKACVHVHGALPYFFVRVDEDDAMCLEHPDAYAAAFRASLESALEDAEQSVRHGRGGERDPPAHPRHQGGPRHVASVDFVTGIPFYGYQEARSVFLRIALFHPDRIGRAARLVQSGCVLRRIYQPYESHVGFLLQFLMDFGLAGMDIVEAIEPRVRVGGPGLVSGETFASPRAFWEHSTASQPGQVVDPPPSPRSRSPRPAGRLGWSTTCRVEADVDVRHETLRGVSSQSQSQRTPARPSSDSGSVRTNATVRFPVEGRCIPSLAVLWDEEIRRCRDRHIPPPTPPPISPSLLPAQRPTGAVGAVLGQESTPGEREGEGAWGDALRAQLRQAIESASETAPVESVSPQWERVWHLSRPVESAGLPGVVTESRASDTDSPHYRALLQTRGDPETWSLFVSQDQEAADAGEDNDNDNEDDVREIGPSLGQHDDDEDNDEEDEERERDQEREGEQEGGQPHLQGETQRSGASSPSPRDLSHRQPLQRPAASRCTPSSDASELVTLLEEMQKSGVSQLSGMWGDIAASQAHSEHDGALSPHADGRKESELQLSSPLGRPPVSPPPSRHVSPHPWERASLSLSAKNRPREAASVPLQYDRNEPPSADQSLSEPHPPSPPPPPSSSASLSPPQGERPSDSPLSLSPKAKRARIDSAPAGFSLTLSPAFHRPSLPVQGTQSAIMSPSRSVSRSALVWMRHNRRPPSVSRVCSSMRQYSLDPSPYGHPTFSEPRDTPSQAVVLGGRRFSHVSDHPANLLPFDTFPRRQLAQPPHGARPIQDPLLRLHAPSGRQSPAMGSYGGFVARHLYSFPLSSFRVLRPRLVPPSAATVRAWAKRHCGSAPATPGAAASGSAASQPHRPRSRPQFDDNTGRWLGAAANATPRLTASSEWSSPRSGLEGLTSLSVEVLALSQDVRKPDPRQDPAVAVAWAVWEDLRVHAQGMAAHGPQRGQGFVRGCILVEPFGPGSDSGPLWAAPGAGLALGPNVHIWVVPDEQSLLQALVWVVRQWDPDILLGYEVQTESWGWLHERASTLGWPLSQRVSRVPSGPPHPRDGKDNWGRRKSSEMWVVGRHVLNVWRLMRSELKLPRYRWEDVCLAVLRETAAVPTHAALTQWLKSGPRTQVWALQHALRVATDTLRMLAHVDLTGRTAEMARLFGIDFFSVLTRGSQFRVEAVMLRIARPLGYVAPSPSRTQVARQAALEALPMILEPESRWHDGPVIVLDFQSLYPSLVIAYNLCFSTCLGRLLPTGTRPASACPVPREEDQRWSGTDDREASEQEPPPEDDPAFLGGEAAAAISASPDANTNQGLLRKLGFARYRPPQGALRRLGSRLFLAPNGALFASANDRPGVLPRMLREILDTRVMVKQAMKRPDVQDDPILTRVLHARQFALKMLANVTYGYTSASFSGRMPCAELADAIVQSGRNTLEATMRMVEADPEWRARVVYGDTDSLFVCVPGRSREEAFRIGREICKAVTESQPRPVLLKLEKVYDPCLLVTKKRYIGWKFEQPDDPNGSLEAKGLELVRRDSCPLVGRVMRSAVTELFQSRDLSRCKRMLAREWQRVLADEVPLHEYVFAREVRLGQYARQGTLPPAAVVASKAMASDPRAVPRYAERVAFVVVYGQPGARLVDLVVDPQEVIARPAELRVNAQYYITKQVIPTLQRLFGLVGVDLHAWFAGTRRPRAARPRPLPLGDPQRNPWAARAEAESRRSLPEGVVHASRLVLPWFPLATRHARTRDRTGVGTLDTFALRSSCELCGQKSSNPVCAECCQPESEAMGILFMRRARAEQAYQRVCEQCLRCTGVRHLTGPAASCESLACPVQSERLMRGQAFAHIRAVLAETGWDVPE